MAWSDSDEKRSSERLLALKKKYGLSFVRAEESLEVRWEDADWRRAEEMLEDRLEALAEVLAESLTFGKEAVAKEERLRRARLCVGLGGTYGVELADPLGEQAGAWFSAGALASFSADDSRLSVMAPLNGEAGGMDGFGHEWAHALDAALGRNSQHRGNPMADAERVLEAARQAFADKAKAPFQELAAALARAEAAKVKRGERGLTLAALEKYGAKAIVKTGWRQKAGKALEPAVRIAERITPTSVDEMSDTEIKKEMALARGQTRWLRQVAQDIAEETMKESADFGAKISSRKRKSIAEELAGVVQKECERESRGRRGREVAFDKIKESFAKIFERRLGLRWSEAQKAAGEVMSLEAAKKKEGDLEFSAPYTGRPDWQLPGSLHDISCAIIRAERNLRTLENPELTKEKLAPLAHWWLARAEVSKTLLGTAPMGREDSPRMVALVLKYARVFAGLEKDPEARERIWERAKAMGKWVEAKGENAFGAALFSDLPGTGRRLAREEAAQIGVSLTEAEAASLQKKLASASEYLGARRAAREAFAIGFERRIARMAREGAGEKAKKAEEMERLGMIEALGPREASDASAWMFGAGGRGKDEDRDWDALLSRLWDVVKAMSPRATSAEERKARGPRM